jgi:hypothetical protein
VGTIFLPLSEAITLRIYSREVLGSNPARDAAYSDRGVSCFVFFVSLSKKNTPM